MSRNEQNDDALNAYVGRVARIQSMLERLTNAALDHFDTHPDDIHWGHVSSLGDLEQKLKQICDQTFNEGEHA